MSTNQGLYVQNSGCFSSSSSVKWEEEDAILGREVLATHAALTPSTNVIKSVDVKSILRTVKSIVYSSSSFISTEEHVSREDAYCGGCYGRLNEDVLDAIQKVTCEMCCNAPVGATTMAILKLLSNFEWEAKLAIPLAAFAVKYGEFLMVNGPHPLLPKPEYAYWHCPPANALAQSVDLLRRWALPDLLEIGSVKKMFAGLIGGVVEVTTQMVKFNELKQHYVAVQEMCSASASASVHDLPLHIYRFINGVAFCTSILSSRIQPVQVTEFQTLAVDIERRRRNFEYQLLLSHQRNARQIFTNTFTTSHTTITTNVIDMLICSMVNQPPLRDCCSGEWVNIEVLRGKKVFLFISNLNIFDEELEILREKFEMLHKREGGFCVMVWLPITTVDLIKDTTFNNKRMKMIGYTVRHPLLPDAWGSNEEATLVAVDQEGKVMCPNALHTFRIWGCKALQFSGFKERELWREEKWGIRLLLDTVDSFTLNERRSDDLICLYGGVKEEWLRDFQREATKLMNQRDMIYVGKSNSTKEQISTLLTHCNTIDTWRHYKTVRHFWARLTSILHVGHQLVHVGENDVVLNEAKSLLALDGHREGWALFGTVGGSEMVAAAGESILPALKRCAERQVVETSGRSMILVALKECIGSSNNVGIMWPQAANHCCCMAMARDFDCKYSKNPMGTQCSQTMAPHTMSRCCCRHP